MPGEDGAELLAHVKNVQPHCQRLLLTGQADNELLQRAVNSGNVEEIFYKPINVETIRSAIKSKVDKVTSGTREVSTRQRHYSCYSCHYKAFRLDLVDGVKWQSQIEEGSQDRDLHYFYNRSYLKENLCPKCLEGTFMSITSKIYEIGLEFTALNKDLDTSLDQIITNALSFGTSMDPRYVARVEGNFIPVQMEKRFQTGAELFDAYLSDISRGGVRLESVENYNIGQRVSLDLGVEGRETTQVPAKIMHKTKISSGFSYGLRFEYFDVDAQAKLNHFIDELALGEYQEREDKKQKKQLAVGVGGAGFSGFFGGIAATFILFGGFYFLSDYQLAKKDKIITVTEGGKNYKINLGKAFKGKAKGLPKALANKLMKAKQKCKKDEACFKSSKSKAAKPS